MPSNSDGIGGINKCGCAGEDVVSCVTKTNGAIVDGDEVSVWSGRC